MKVCIVTGGKGSRLGDLTKYYDKSMLPIGKKPALSLILEQYPIDTEYVIILGFGGNYIQQFCLLAYPERRFTFVRADEEVGGTQQGLTHALLQAKDKLQEPFIFQTNDTLFDSAIPIWLDLWDTHTVGTRSHNIMLMSNKWVDTKTYRSIATDDKSSDERILDKCVELPPHVDVNKLYSYIGVAFINDWKEFWEALEKGDEKETGEVIGLKYLYDEMKDMLFVPVDSWYDLGDLEKYAEAVKDFSDFDNLSKAGEAIYFLKGQVFKFSVNKEFIANRISRAEKLEGVVPKIRKYMENFYAYNYEEGTLISDLTVTPKIVRKLLEYCYSDLWHLDKFQMNPIDFEKFYQKCFSFYYEKTLDRVNSYFQKYSLTDSETIINDEKIPPIINLLDKINWIDMRHGVPCRFHGDLHFENILKQGNKFVFLDWRQDFMGLWYGDLYYDLAKLLHGLLLSDDIIRKKGFTVDEENFRFLLRSDFYLAGMKELEGWTESWGYDWKKVKIINSLIYINMAPLHDYPVSKLLFNLGKWLLFDIEKDKKA